MKSNYKFDNYKFSVLEKIEEEQLLKGYNEEFFSYLMSYKMLNLPVENKNKLFFHFQQNQNASISTTTSQLLVFI